MSSKRSDNIETTSERIEKIKKNYVMRYETAKKLGVADDMAFPDWLDLDQPARRRFLAGTAAAGTAVVAGCAGDDEPAGDDDGDDGSDADDGGDDEDEVDDDQEVHEFDMTAYQFGFEPQQIEVPEGDIVRINFKQATFEEESGFNIHDWHLLEPYDEHVVLPEDTDPDTTIDTVEFVADEPGRHMWECTLYCGSGHAQMKGELLVGDEAASFDYRNIEDVASTQEVLKEESELAQSPEMADDLENLLAVVERDNASMTFVDMENYEQVGRAEDVGQAIHVNDFHSEALENKRESAYMYTMARDGWLYKIDLFGGEPVARVRVGTDGRDLALSRDNQYLCGGLYAPGQLFVVDAETMEPLKQITTQGIDLDGQFVESRVCALYDAPHYGVWVAALKELGEVWLIDYTQDEGEDAFPVVAQIDCARTLHDGFFTKDGRYFMLASQSDNVMSIIDLEEQELVKNLDVGEFPHPGPGALDAEAHRAFSTHIGDDKMAVWDTDNFELEKLIDVPGGGLFLRDHPDCDYIWADVALRDDPDLDQLVYAVGRDSLEVEMQIETGSDHAIHPIFSNDGQEIFVSHWPEGEIHVYDSHTGEHVTEVDGDFFPCTGKFPVRRADKLSQGWEP